MTLIEFAKSLPDDWSEEEFIAHLKRSLDLDAIKDMPGYEIDNLFDASQFLVDYLLLIREFKGQLVEQDGAPVIVYRGPFIQNILTKAEGSSSDFSQVKTFGVGGADKHL